MIEQIPAPQPVWFVGSGTSGRVRSRALPGLVCVECVSRTAVAVAAGGGERRSVAVRRRHAHAWEQVKEAEVKVDCNSFEANITLADGRQLLSTPPQI